MKIYYLTKKDYESLGCKVITGSNPVTVMNEMTLPAKCWKFKDMNEVKQSSLINDTKAMGSYIFMLEPWIDETAKEFAKTVGDDIVDDVNDANVIYTRLYFKK